MQTQTAYKNNFLKAHQRVYEMFSRAKVLSENGLRETLLTSKAQIKMFRLNLSADTHHNQRYT